MKLENFEHGFSLLEVTVALLVMSVVMGTAFALLNRFQQAYRYEEANAEAQRNGRFAIARLQEIIRSAGTNPTNNSAVNGASFIQFPDGNPGPSIRLLTDLNGDGLFTASVSANSDAIVTSEDVTLKLVGDKIMLIDNTLPISSPRKTLVIAENIRSLTFSDPNPSASRREIIVNLTAIPGGIGDNDPRYTQVIFTSAVRVRNR
jgi:prepilin-type N-terminal cleavage/methylation domain-containing protein